MWHVLPNIIRNCNEALLALIMSFQMLRASRSMNLCCGEEWNERLYTLLKIISSRNQQEHQNNFFGDISFSELQLVVTIWNFESLA